jgi:LuxR family transcriptional regulator, maltose regulon positive regulatory protein
LTAASTEALPSAPPFDLLESKLLEPRVRTGILPRDGLISALERSRTPVVCLSAGPGWGKTTLLAQWASKSERSFAWLSVDERDNDPIVLLTYVAVALDRVSPLDPSVFQGLASPGVSVEGTLVPRLGAALAAMDRPVVLALDDLHLVDNPTCLDAIGATRSTRGRRLTGRAVRARRAAAAARRATSARTGAGDRAGRAPQEVAGSSPASSIKNTCNWTSNDSRESLLFRCSQTPRRPLY